jgi:hypothetical protein
LDSLIWIGDHGILAVVISVLLSALLFWWINIRYGKLISDFPKDFSVRLSDKEGLIGFDIPLLLYNTGTPDIVIRDCRIIIENANKSCSFWSIRAGNGSVPELL